MPPRRRNDTRPPQTPPGRFPTESVPARSDIGENSASGLIESPQPAGKDKLDKLDPHEFADGGGSGGAEAFSRKKTRP